MKNGFPRISVIIPAKNEEKYIHNALDGLREQSLKDFETIVVDGGSSDDTVKIARKYATVAVELRRGVSRGRNKGAKLAKGEILLFLDADTKPSADLLKIYSKTFEDGKVVAATGPIYPLEKSPLRVRLGYAFVSVLFVKASMAIGRPSVVGSNFAVRRSTFNRIGGFDNRLITYEDWNLSARLKKFGRIAYIDDAVVYTSARRIRKWGVLGFFKYYVGNMARYHLTKRSKDDYEAVR